MKGKLVPMIGLAVVFGALSIFAADRFVKSRVQAETPVAETAAAPEIPQISTRKVVVAKADLKYGAEINADTAQLVDWPADSAPAGAFASLEDLLGGGRRVALATILANEPIVLSKLSGKDGRASLSNLLEPGKRAVTIRVDDITGVAGFVTPGDRVDVILTRQKNGIVPQPANPDEVTASAGQPTSELASEVILQNIKVLTADQSADQSATQAAVAKAVTIEVSSDEAQKVALAQQMGTLYLLLRPAGDASAATQSEFTASNLNKPVAASLATPAASPADAPSILSLENEGPKYRSLVVTRGHTEETYSVIDENGGPVAPVAGNNN